MLKIQSKLDDLQEVHSVDSATSDSPFPDSIRYQLLHKRECCGKCDARSVNDDGCSTIALVVDGPTLQYMLSPNLKPIFQEVSRKCRAVMCCRATPLQKVREKNYFLLNDYSLYRIYTFH